MTAKRETSEKRERMIGECHICSSSGPAAPRQESVLWRTTHMHGSVVAAHNAQHNKAGVRQRIET